MIFSSDSQKILAKSISYATQSGHEYCVQEHVLFFLMEDATVKKVLLDCNADINKLKQDVLIYLSNEIPVSSARVAAKTSLGIERLIHSAISQVSLSGKSEVKPVDLLFAFTTQNESFGMYVMAKQNIDALKLKKALASTSRSVPEPSTAAADEKSQEKDYLVNLNERVSQGKIDPLIGRDHEVERVIQILGRRRKNNPILVGEPGVGKTAIAEGLAHKIVNKQVPKNLESAVVLSLDIGCMMAGTKFRGDFEEKMKEMLAILKKTPNSILFIDEIHTIIGAGATSGGSLDSANMLKPLLTTGEIKVIGSTTYKEFNNIFEKDAALARRFQKVDVIEPSIEDTIKILEGLKPSLEQHHSVKYHKDSIKAAVELSVKHINDRFLPDKAIDILDEAGSMLHLKGEKTVTVDVIEKTIAKIARIPEKTVSTEEKSKIKGLMTSLKEKIFGQDEALDTVVSSIELSTSGLRGGEKPIGNFLFCGPTGVGKTELCKQLSSHLGVPLIRFDMSEYMEKHTVAKLIGAPPGYVGFDQNGLLTDAARKNPHSIILLDEIEKAHPDVWNILLQVMDHGTLTDSNGRKADFKHTIIIMTSNVGASELSRASIGFGRTESTPAKPTKAVETTFTPEFRNRLDAIVYFNQLSKENIYGVVDKNFNELKGQLKEKNVSIEISKEAKAWLADKGYDPNMGARPMARLIQDKIKRPLSSQLLYGELIKGGHVVVSVKDDNIHFEFGQKTKRTRKVKELA